jgi:hypothetical protein
MSNTRRWGDNDRKFGPFTFAYDRHYRPLTALVSTNGGCHLRLGAFGATLICELPRLINGYRKWVDLPEVNGWSRGGYWDCYPKEYGFRLSEGHFYVSLGAQTHDSSTTRSRSCFVPWTQWRQVRHQLYGADGYVTPNLVTMPWRAHHAEVESLVKHQRKVKDFDGEVIDVDIYIEERDFRLGERWFKWIGYLAPMKRRRSIDIRFLSEVGRDKGSWKGGMIGTRHEMLPGESVDDSFFMFCEQEQRSRNGRYRLAVHTQDGAAA